MFSKAFKLCLLQFKKPHPKPQVLCFIGEEREKCGFGTVQCVIFLGTTKQTPQNFKFENTEAHCHNWRSHLAGKIQKTPVGNLPAIPKTPKTPNDTCRQTRKPEATNGNCPHSGTAIFSLDLPAKWQLPANCRDYARHNATPGVVFQQSRKQWTLIWLHPLTGLFCQKETAKGLFLGESKNAWFRGDRRKYYYVFSNTYALEFFSAFVSPQRYITVLFITASGKTENGPKPTWTLYLQHSERSHYFCHIKKFLPLPLICCCKRCNLDLWREKRDH